MMDDIEDTDNACPRVQRISKASGEAPRRNRNGPARSFRVAVLTRPTSSSRRRRDPRHRRGVDATRLRTGCAERDVALFMAEFEAMRQSTERIAKGEDPDAVNADIGSSNRAQRRMLKKQKQSKKR